MCDCQAALLQTTRSRYPVIIMTEEVSESRRLVQTVGEQSYLSSLLRYITAHLIRFLLYADLTSLIFPLAEESISSRQVQFSSNPSLSHYWRAFTEQVVCGGAGGVRQSVDGRKKQRSQVFFVACTLLPHSNLYQRHRPLWRTMN